MITGRPATAGRLAAGRDHAIAARLAAQERRAVQRRHEAHGVLRSVRGAERRRLARGDHDRRGPAVPERAVHHELAFPSREGSVEVESKAMPAAVHSQDSLSSV